MATPAHAADVAHEFAPAKINLALHVVGRRADGYHLIESLTVFARLGDTLAATPAPQQSLFVDGPFATAIAADDPADNLVLRAASLLTPGQPQRFDLTKRIPV